MKVLITGFEPFGGMPVNPSQVIADSFKATTIQTNFELDILSSVLPVDFKESGESIITLVKENKPDLVLAMGVDLAKSSIELEKVAHKNLEYLSSELLELVDPHIDLDTLPDNFYTNINLDVVLERVVSKGGRTIISDDTGMYVCNHIYYLLKLLTDSSFPEMKSLFVHLPYPYPYYIEEAYINPEYKIKDIQEDVIKILSEILQLMIDDHLLS